MITQSNKNWNLKNVTINEPFFSGHFPNKPIMPGVLLLESMAQSACLIILDFIDNPEDHLVYLSKVNNFNNMFYNTTNLDVDGNINAKNIVA